MVPMIGWPAKGSSSLSVKMSSRRSDVPVLASWRKTVSEKLNSRAIVCLVSCERRPEAGKASGKGTWTTASWFPLKRVVVKTSRVEQGRESEGGNFCVLIRGGGVTVASREFGFEANCTRRCSKVFISLKTVKVSLKGLSGSEGSRYCLSIEITSLERYLMNSIATSSMSVR